MKLSRIFLVLMALGIPALAVARSMDSSCCRPGAKCCEDGSCPMCHHAS